MISPLKKLLLAVLILASCDGKRLYDRYETIPQDGWERSDTLAFAPPPIPSAGLYDIQLGLRTTGEYPFMTLALIVDATVFHAKDSIAPAKKEVHSYAISCPLTNNRGQSEGQGVGFYQYRFPVTAIRLDSKDSLAIRIRHDMKRETIPGISNVGIGVRKK